MWRIRSVTIAAVILGLCQLAFSMAVLAMGRSALQLEPEALRTLAFVTLLLGGQAALYVVRERGHLWMSRPSRWLIAASLAGVGLALVPAATGLLMAPLPLPVILGVLAATALFTLVLDCVKTLLMGRLTVA